MNKPTTRSYHSPLRAAQARETQEKILQGVATWMESRPQEEFTLAGIAKLAGIERRTVFRHFPTKEALLASFWVWINHKVTAKTLPASLSELLAAPQDTFARFDAEEGLIRASLHTQAGRDMRLASVPARQLAFREALGEVTRTAPPAERRNLECIAHALYSAAAWETMRDYAGVSGAEAGNAVSWALTILANAVREGAGGASGRTRASTRALPISEET